MLVRPDGFVPKERYTTRDVRRARARRGCGRGCGRSRAGRRRSRPGRLRRVRRSATRRSRSCATSAATLARVPQRVPAPRPAPRRGLRHVRRRRDPVPVPRLVLRARRPARRRSRPRRVHRPARRPRAARRCASTRGAGSCSSTSTPTPSRCSTSSTRCPRCSRRTTSTRCGCAASLTHDHRRELEGGRRRVQRGLPRAGPAPADPAVDRRRQHRVRAVRHARALRPAARRAARAAAEPAPRPRPPTTTTRARSSRAWSPGSAARSSARSAPRSTSCARPDRRPGTTLLEAYQAAPHGAARGARLRRLGPRARAHDERRRRVLLPERRRPDLSRQRDPVPRAPATATIPTARSRTRGCSSGGRPGSEAGAAQAAVLRRLARPQLGRDHRAGLREPRQRAARDALVGLGRARGSTPARRATSCTCTA